MVRDADASRGGAREPRHRRGPRALPPRAHPALARVRARGARAARRAAALPPRGDGRGEEHDRRGEAPPGEPVLLGAALRGVLVANARRLAGTLLNGEVYSVEFLPTGGAYAAFAGLAAIAVQGFRTKLRWRAALVIGLALAIFGPCAYVTFLWNRLRYLWPFAPGWFIGLACLARLAGDALAAVHSRARVVVPLACGAVVGMLWMRLDGSIDDVARSASEIDRQQVTLGRWAKEALPASARIGLNDTGAIAYFGEHKTFDVVGLTTRSEGRYWVAGAGSRLEHYERLRATSPASLPTHFIVYPEWFGIEPLLGPQLEEATVLDASILGGKTMRAHLADYSLLGSGEAPWTPLGAIVDTLDVADLESEAEHAYELLGARDAEQIAGYGAAPDGRFLLDGGRTMRTRERFVAHLHPGERTRAVVRLEASVPTRVQVLVGGREVALFEVEPAAWTEAFFNVPAGDAKGETPIELVAEGGALAVFHYWFGAPPSPLAGEGRGVRARASLRRRQHHRIHHRDRPIVGRRERQRVEALHDAPLHRVVREIARPVRRHRHLPRPVDHELHLDAPFERRVRPEPPS